MHSVDFRLREKLLLISYLNHLVECSPVAPPKSSNISQAINLCLFSHLCCNGTQRTHAVSSSTGCWGSDANLDRGKTGRRGGCGGGKSKRGVGGSGESPLLPLPPLSLALSLVLQYVAWLPPGLQASLIVNHNNRASLFVLHNKVRFPFYYKKTQFYLKKAPFDPI